MIVVLILHWYADVVILDFLVGGIPFHGREARHEDKILTRRPQRLHNQNSLLRVVSDPLEVMPQASQIVLGGL